MASVTSHLPATRPALHTPVRHPVLSTVVHASTTALMLIQHRMFLVIDDPTYQIMAYAVPAAWALYYAWFVWARRCLIRESGGGVLRAAMRRAQTLSRYQ
ncbi:MAG TPA: hypothetical protein VFT99_06255 [Roseiflexaceae bacterium]|nr:hypothetical protein [Roseiflexaceae bacterium]